MREKIMLHPDVDKFIRSVVPSDGEPTKNKNNALPATITIYADNGMFAMNGSNHKHIRPMVLFMILTFVVIIVSLNTRISVAQAERLSDSVKEVAVCEEKTANKVHSELRDSYNYDRYSNMNLIDYYRAQYRLSSRKCG